MTGYCVFECKQIGLKRDLRCINPCKSGDGSYLTKLTSPPNGGGGGRNANFRGSTNQKSGKCHELSRQSVIFFLTHPTPGGSEGGGGWGSKFQKSGKFHELSRKSIKKSPPPTKGGRSANFRGSKNQKSGKCHELPRKVIKKINPTPPHQGLGVLKGNNFKCQTFHELEKIDIFC